MLRSAGPNPLTSRAYAKDLNEVKAIGALHSTTRTPDETDAAIFWQDHAFALWNRVFRSLAADHHLAIADSARLLATTNLAAADAAIGCWNNKYHYNSWRPITAIREADTDANPATTADPTWTPLFDPATPVAAGQLPLATPPFPENPSGHNCAAGAILGTLRYFFGTNDVSFTATSNKSGTTRTFHSLSDALQENINARVWAGIHFRTADLQGVKLGTTVARYLHQHYFQPTLTTTTATDPPDPEGANPQYPQATLPATSDRRSSPGRALGERRVSGLVCMRSSDRRTAADSFDDMGIVRAPAVPQTSVQPRIVITGAPRRPRFLGATSARIRSSSDANGLALDGRGSAYVEAVDRRR